MKRFFILSALLCIIFNLYTRPALADKDTIQTQAYIGNPQFEAMARKALMDMPRNFNFTDFRLYYTMTRQYDPIGEATIDAMLKDAYVIQTQADNPEAYKKALDDYQLILLNHMAHLGVVLQASALAKTDRRFGDPEFFTWLKAGLIRDLILSGNGNSLREAYDIITLDEEAVLFNYLAMQPIETLSRREGVVYYNMHTAINLKDGVKHTVFVNTSFPMKYLETKTEKEKFYTKPIYKR